MNRTIPKIGAAVVSAAVFLFALCLIFDYSFGSYFVCMFLPLGYIMTAAGLAEESPAERRVPAIVGLVLAAIYTTLIFVVYFAQTTSVLLDGLDGQALRILDFQQGGLLFNYDLLGYGVMALSTFFTGLSMTPKRKVDRWLKWLLIIHGAFFPGCFLLPMTGMFTSMAGGNGGSIALLGWCTYFLPVGILAVRHFGKAGMIR